jgi:mRNA interferase HigB
MKILGKQWLDRFLRKHGDATTAISSWIAVLEGAEIGGPQDIKNLFATASFLSNNRVIFNIRGNNYRLVTVVVYIQGQLIVEWVGTHAEYDKRRW